MNGLKLALITAALLMAPAAFAKAPQTPISSAPAKAGQWQWIDMPSMKCRDGSSTGFAVRLQPRSTAVMIYLQGGGACYDAQSCAENAGSPLAGENYNTQKFIKWAITLGNQGVFNTRNKQNPVAGWNHVYVPYCSGDLHGGMKPNARVPGMSKAQNFTGYRNVAIVLDKVSRHFKNPQDVALVGASAGGFGVLINYPQTVKAFNGRSVVAFVDSAPIIPEAKIKTSCFQNKVNQAFNLQVPASCPECSDPNRGGLINMFKYLPKTYPNGRFAFASADADIAGVVLYDRESKACGGAGVNIFNYRQSLYKLRDQYMYKDWSTFLPGGLQHTMTQSDKLFLDRKFKGKSAAQWLPSVNAKRPEHIPPVRLH